LIDARAQGQDAYDKMWMASICVFCIQAAVMLILVFTLAPFLGDIFHLEPEQRSLARSIFIVVGLLNILNYVLSVCSTALLAGQLLSKINNIMIIYSLVQLAVFALGAKMGMGLWAYPLALSAAIVCSQVLAIKQAVKYKLLGKFELSLLDWGEVKTVFKLGLDVFVAAVFSMVMGSSLLIFSGHLLTMEETAILAVNLKLVSMMTQILQRVPGSASPMLMKLVSEGKDNQFRFWWELITKLTLSLALICAGCFVIWNKIVVTLWTSAEMLMPTGALILLSLIPFRYLVHYQYVNSLTIFKEIRKVKWMLLWEIILYTGLAFWLGGSYGMMGLLSANLLSMLGGALFVGMRWFSYFSHIAFRELVALLLRVSVPMALAFLMIYLTGLMRLNQSFAGSLALTMIWAVLFSGIGYYVILGPEDREKLWGLVGSLKRKLLKRSI